MYIKNIERLNHFDFIFLVPRKLRYFAIYFFNYINLAVYSKFIYVLLSHVLYVYVYGYYLFMVIVISTVKLFLWLNESFGNKTKS